MPASEERSISEFPSALSILATTLLLVSTYDSGNDTYDSEKVTAVDLASAILGDFEFTQDLATNVKTIFGAINSIMVLSGTTVPSSAIGSNGQLYVKYTSSGGTDTVDSLYWKINNAWVEISTGGGGGGASVTLGTTVPSDASGSNGDLYVQYDGTTYAVIEYFVKIFNSWRKAPYSRVVALTQAEYDLITPDPTTLYIITDAQSSYQTKTDSNLQTTANTVVGAINELNSGKQDSFTMGSISVNDLFTNTSNILGVDAYQIGKIVVIARLRCKGGTYDGTYVNYGTFKSPYVPKSSTRFLWDKGGTGTNIIGYAESGGLYIKDSDTTSENYGYSFAYIIN